MADNGPEFHPGSVGAEIEHHIDPERQRRDFDIVKRIQEGYTPFIDKNGKKGPAIAGTLTDDAAEALGQLAELYTPEMHREAHDRAPHTDMIAAVDGGDLANEAYFCVYHAATTWRLGGSSFLTHLKRYMPNYLNGYMDEHRTNVRLRREMRRRIRSIGNTYWAKYGKDEQPPADVAIAEELEISDAVMKRTRFAQNLSERMGSLERDNFEDRPSRPRTQTKQSLARWLPIDVTLEPLPSIEHNLIADDRHALVESIVHGGRFVDLNDRDRRILYLRYIDPEGPYTMEEVGERLDVTRQRIQQLEKRALRNLRQALAARRLTDYLDVDD
jgi:RNA polymerase sigma factor (sigma-70 family)